MNQLKGYVYLRDNAWYKIENVIKLGITTFAKDRNNTYITGEVERGEYISVIEIQLDKIKCIDICLKNYFKNLNIYKGGGTEFYNRCIIDLIESYFKNINIPYKILTKEEINNMNRCERIRNIPNYDNVKKIFNKLNVKNIIQTYKIKQNKNSINNTNSIVNNSSYIIEPKKHQQYILKIIQDYFNSYSIGKIIWPCGLGKTILSILAVKLLKFENIVIGVPRINLQAQFKTEILKIFPNKSNILFVGGDETDGIKSSNEILNFINKNKNNINNEPKFIISTYSSCYLLVHEDISFEFKIGDEAHHLVGIQKEEDKGFRSFHNIKSSKTLFMTATEKTIQTRTNKEIYTMEDENKFGKYIDVKNVNWAIENKKITDYNILLLKNTENEINEIITNLKVNISNKEIFISCYMCLKSFEKYKDLTHILLYTNTTEDSEISKKYIDEILALNILSIKKDKIYNNAIHSRNYNNDLDNQINIFKNACYGIISCIQIFGEGFDLPKLNGVCIVGNMESETRIVQCSLRPNRLDPENPNKKAYIIIPYIDGDNLEIKNKSYEKVRNIISHMRNVDENIEQKILVFVGKKEKKKDTKKEEMRSYYQDYIFQENGDELNKIKLRLKYSKALGSKFTEEQDEYNYVRSINSSLNIKSKEEYIQKKNIHCNFIDLPEEYFKSKGVWNNWYDFLGVDTSKFIQSKKDWINFCKEKNIKSLDDYYRCCDEYDILPKEPAVFYKDFTNIPSELGFNKNRRK